VTLKNHSQTQIQGKLIGLTIKAPGGKGILGRSEHEISSKNKEEERRRKRRTHRQAKLLGGS